MDGIINILKPAGMTSMNVISRVRRILSEKKVGHTGTLDPDVTGVLPIFAGKATRAIHYVQDGGKSYSAEMVLGKSTSTQDGSGEVLSSASCEATDVQVSECLMNFVGKYIQIPPMYSAKKIDGKKLCDLARKGIEVERREHPVEIYSINIHAISRNALQNGDVEVKVKFEVDCSRGTYIRTLCNDVGVKLGCGGYMSWLERTRSCGFSILDGVSLEQLEKALEDGNTDGVVSKTQSIFDYLPRIKINGVLRVDLLNGKTIDLVEELTLGLNTLFDDDDIFVGLCKVSIDEKTKTSKIKMERQFVI